MNRRYPLPITLVLVSVALGGCPTSPAYIECDDDTSCGLAVGGHCLPNPATGHTFCQYPDGTCPGGFRWSDHDVEESISGVCVADMRDAGVDAVDAPIDAPINDGTIPCGLRVAFHDGADNAREVWVANADGSGLVNVSNNAADDANPSWSPDGTRLVFQSKRGGRWDLYIVNRDGSGLANLTNTPTADEQNPGWSPDGQRIAFLGGGGLSVIYPNGTGAVTVTTRAPSGPFSWSPDSTRLVFPSVTPNIPDLWVATVGSGAQPINLTNSTLAETGGAWAPGPKIAYATTDLFTVNGDGTGSANLTPSTSHFEYQPHWSSDGQQIVFTSNEQTDYEIHRIAATGGAVTRVLDNSLGAAGGVGDWVQDVAADGRIVFERRTSFTASAIGVVAADGSGAAFFNGTGGTNARGAVFAHCP